jgi:hypothetical protein
MYVSIILGIFHYRNKQIIVKITRNKRIHWSLGMGEVLIEKAPP